MSQMNSLMAATNPMPKPNSAWMSYVTIEVMAFLWYFCLFWPKLGCHGNLAIRNVFFGLVDHENPLLEVITFSLSLVEMHLYAFITTLVPKFVAMVMPLCPLCTGVSQTNSLMLQPYLKTKLCMDMLHTTEVMAILWYFCLFWPKLGCHGNVLRPLQSEMSSLDCSTTKTPAVSNRILVISHTNAFICI